MRKQTEEKMMLNLEQILDSGQKVVSGKERGIDARAVFDLDKIDRSDEHVVVVVPNDVKVITPSFVLGMFSPSVSKCGSIENFFKKFEFKTPSNLVLEQIQQGAKLGLVKGHALSNF